MDLREWIVSEHLNVCNRLRDQVLGRVPRERWNESVDGGSSIAWILWHTVRHQDVSINAVVRNGEQVLARDDWARRVGATAFAPGSGLSEGDDRAAASALALDQLDTYAQAVWSQTETWLRGITPGELERVPDARASLRQAGVDETAYAWLYRMWEGKPVSFHVGWETVGHGFNHLGEMVSLRNRMGLGGF